MPSEICIADRLIGVNHPPYIVAELSCNHQGELAHAIEIVEAAKEAGANAVKLQTYTADTMTIDHDAEEFMLSTDSDAQTLYALYEKAYTPWEWHADLFKKAADIGITIFSSPFDSSAVDLLVRLHAPAYKIASFELVDTALIKCAARQGKPVIMSTGMANHDEISEATQAARDVGCEQLLLTHCVSGYPTPIDECNLHTLADMSQSFGVPVGWSDHTLGHVTAVAAVALGACLIEKHLTLSRSAGGPDAAFSMEPHELRSLVDATHEAWTALGQISYDVQPSERVRVRRRRSLYVVKDIPAGHVLTHDNVRSIRPGLGIAPKYLEAAIGCRSTRLLKRGEPLHFGDFESTA